MALRCLDVAILHSSIENAKYIIIFISHSKGNERKMNMTLLQELRILRLSSILCGEQLRATMQFRRNLIMQR